jgi:hypothetical protein
MPDRTSWPATQDADPVLDVGLRMRGHYVLGGKAGARVRHSTHNPRKNPTPATLACSCAERPLIGLMADVASARSTFDRPAAGVCDPDADNLDRASGRANGLGRGRREPVTNQAGQHVVREALCQLCQ